MELAVKSSPFEGPSDPTRRAADTTTIPRAAKLTMPAAIMCTRQGVSRSRRPLCEIMRNRPIRTPRPSSLPGALQTVPKQWRRAFAARIPAQLLKCLAVTEERGVVENESGWLLRASGQWNFDLATDLL
jgi:hypothetical protein